MKSFILILLLAFTANLLAQKDCFQTFYKKGNEAFQADDFESAINNYKAAKVCPDKPAVNDVDEKILEAQNGYILAITKARDEAIAAKLEAEQAKRSLEAVTYISQGQEKELEKMFAEAIVFYTKAIDIFPDSIAWYDKRAPLYLHDKVKDFEKGIADYLLLIERGKAKKRAEYYDRLAYAYEQTNQLELAKASLVNAKNQAGPKDASIYALKLNWFDQKMMAVNDPRITKSNEEKKAIFSIAYRWSEYGACDLQLKIKIGDKIYSPTNNNFLIQDLEEGEYDYQILGSAGCAAWGTCDLKGQGKLKVVANSVYYCIWKKNADPGKSQDCQAWLSPF